MLDTGLAIERATALDQPLRPSAPEAGSETTVHISCLKGFPEIVRAAGVDAGALLRNVGLRPDIFGGNHDNLRISFAKTNALLNNAAEILDEPHLGLRLAQEQARSGFSGPLAIAMRNSENFGKAFDILSTCIYTYSDCTEVTIVPEQAGDKWLTRIDILPQERIDDRQFVEHAILTTHMIAKLISGNSVNSREVWLRHSPIGSAAGYQDYFDTGVKFLQPVNAVVFSSEDRTVPIDGSNSEVFHIATNFIERHYAKPEEPLGNKVKRVLIQHRNIGNASTNDVAATMGIHPRTLQRRLRSEGTQFHLIKDEICQELALKYLRDTNIPLIRVANLLGYGELSAFSHRCRHWFSCSPGELRRTHQTQKMI